MTATQILGFCLLILVVQGIGLVLTLLARDPWWLPRLPREVESPRAAVAWYMITMIVSTAVGAGAGLSVALDRWGIDGVGQRSVAAWSTGGIVACVLALMSLRLLPRQAKIVAAARERRGRRSAKRRRRPTLGGRH